MKLQLCTLLLNEIEWLEKLYDQHRCWPGLQKWVFVEGADESYAKANPAMVSKCGLSVDGTTELLERIAKADPHVTVIRHGFMTHEDPAQAKCRGRQRYLDVANVEQPDFLMFLDGDELYTHDDQQKISNLYQAHLTTRHNAFIFRYRNIWRSPPMAERGDGLFDFEVTGGFWDIPHCHGWRWLPGMRYGYNHMTPCDADGVPLLKGLDAVRADKLPDGPQCVHMAFASQLAGRRAKHLFYQERGEGKTDKRSWYVKSREAWETWRFGFPLPRGAKVIPYIGEVPECFRGVPVKFQIKFQGVTP